MGYGGGGGGDLSMSCGAPRTHPGRPSVPDAVSTHTNSIQHRVTMWQSGSIAPALDCMDCTRGVAWYTMSELDTRLSLSTKVDSSRAG